MVGSGMRGHVTIAAEPLPLIELLAANARLRERVSQSEPVALGIASSLDAGRVPGPGQSGQSGIELDVPAGTLVVGLALLHADVLLPTPADRVLNRNVRGLLRGLGAQYFGGEHLVIAGRPIAWVGFDRDAEQRVLIEAFIGVELPIATWPIRDMRGRAYASVRELGIRDSIAQLADRIVAGHARFGVEFQAATKR